MQIQFHQNRRRAMTIMEVMVAMFISLLIVVPTIMVLMLYGSRSFAGLANYLEMNRASRTALDRITTDVRHATRLLSFTNTTDLVELQFWQETNEDGAVEPTGQTLIYQYTAADRILRSIYLPTNGNDMVTNVLLTECDEFKFGLYQRSPVGNATPPSQWDTASAPSQCKLVELNWTCSRQLLQQKLQTESVQTAKIVLRNGSL